MRSLRPDISLIFRFVQLHKWIVALVLCCAVLLALATLRQASVGENIDAMLPDDASSLAEDFRLLGQAPFLARVLVVLRRDSDATVEELTQAARQVRAAAGPPWFSPARPGQSVSVEDMGRLLNMLPALVTPEDLTRIATLLEPKAVGAALDQARQSLLGLDGLALKQQIRMDPLQLRNIIAQRLAGLDLFGQESGPVIPDHGFFLHPDEQSALIVLDTPVAMTDARGARRLTAELDRILAEHVPQGLEAFAVSGHAYTAANARTIQEDLLVVLAVSSLGILILFVLFLRAWQAVLVYLIPLLAMLFGAAAVAAISPVISGITLGFGAVLMGLSVDYGLHVWFGLRRGASPVEVMAALTRPVVFCWLTTAGVFSLLLFSSLPGQRQLALFTVSGLTAAMLLALLVLPVLTRHRWARQKPEQGREAFRADDRPAALFRCLSGTIAQGARPLALGLFAGLILAAVLSWPAIRFDARLQGLSVVTEELARGEQSIARSWGGVRDLAMLFSQGDNLNEALDGAFVLHGYLEHHLPRSRIISLAPVLPPAEQQYASILRWQAFWDQHAPALRETLQAEGARRGFARDAFAPFFAWLNRTPRLVAPSGLADALSDGLAQDQGNEWESATEKELGVPWLAALTDLLIVQDKGVHAVLTLVPDTPRLHALFAASDHNRPQILDQVRLISPTLLGEDIAEALRRDMTRFVWAAAIFVALFTSLLFSDVRRTIQALVPAVSGLAALCVALPLLDVVLNLYSVAAMFLVLGLGVDYGIFMALGHEKQEELGTRRAVLVSGLSTLAGFGALILARHPALHSIGLTVLIGIAAALPAALFVAPALGRGKQNA